MILWLYLAHKKRTLLNQTNCTKKSLFHILFELPLKQPVHLLTKHREQHNLSLIVSFCAKANMHRITRVVRAHDGIFNHANRPDSSCNKAARAKVFSRFECVTSSRMMEQRGLENTTVEDVLKTKGENDTSMFWCRTTDTVFDAVKNMTQHNIGSLLVLKPGEKKLVAGIITERDYLKKIIVQGRHSKTTRVGEIMTEENKLVTVNSDANILEAMKLMTENHIRHMPVIDAKIVGMISIVDVIRAVVEQQNQEVNRLNDFIKGEYY